MTRCWFGAAVLVLAATACNGDDDDAVESVPETAAAPTAVPTTEVPPTTESTTTTVEPTTAAVDEEALKAQIAADYLAVQQALEDLQRAPTLDNLDERMASIAVPASEGYVQIRTSIEQDVASGERTVPGDPDYSDVFVEAVELPDGAAGQTAVVTACIVNNETVVNADGQPILSGPVIAARVRDTLQQTSGTWLITAPFERVGVREGMTSCAF